jgi:hypothetical protein
MASAFGASLSQVASLSTVAIQASQSASALPPAAAVEPLPVATADPVSLPRPAVAADPVSLPVPAVGCASVPLPAAPRGVSLPAATLPLRVRASPSLFLLQPAAARFEDDEDCDRDALNAASCAERSG